MSAAMQSDQQQIVYKQWFTIADEDRDGAIAGIEAVKFFSRSGLDQATLGQVWELASNGAPKLTLGQFISALRLVSLAQAHGRLPLEQARVIAAGMGQPLPLPRMQGLQGLEQFGAPAYSPQSTGPMAPAAGPTGGFPAAGYTQQFTGAAAPGPAHSYAAQFTGTPYQPQTTGAQAAPGAAAAAFAPATPSDLQRYQAAFQQLDADRDGVVQGSDCFTYFMQWGLDKNTLRHIWEIVAGNSSSLTQSQLTSCLYLMDASKRGIKPPSQLPPGPFPPVAQQWSLQSQFGGASAAAGGPAVSQQAVVLPSMPALPTRFAEPDGPEAAGAPRSSQVPNLTSAMGQLNQGQKDKLAAELKEAGDRESRLMTVEEKAAQTKARMAQFNAAMQEVTVFKSRTDVALLQAQDQASRLEEELVVARAKYDKAYTAAQSQGETARKLREYLGKLMQDKTDQEGKLLQLEAEIAAANAVTPADVARMEAEVRALHDRIQEQENLAMSKGSQVAGIRQQRVALEARLAEVRAAAAAAEGEVKEAQKEVSDLQASITGAIKAVGGGEGARDLPSLLSKAAELYRRLYAAVLKAGGDVPFDVLPANLGLASWMDDAMQGVVDWNDMDDEARGYVLVNALPGQRVDVSKGKAALMGAMPAAPIPADAFGEASAFGDAPAFAAATPAAAAAPVAATPVAAQAAPVVPAGALEGAAGFEDDAFAPQGSVSGPTQGSGSVTAPAAPAGTVPPAATPTASAAVVAAAPAATTFGFDDNAF